MARTNRATPTKKTGASAKPDRTVPIVGIVFGLVAVAVVAAIVFGGGGDTSPSDFTPGDPSVSGQRLSAKRAKTIRPIRSSGRPGSLSPPRHAFWTKRG